MRKNDIKRLNLSVRTTNTLYRYAVFTTTDLRKCTLRQLKRAQGMGKKGVEEIEHALTVRNWQLKERKKMNTCIKVEKEREVTTNCRTTNDILLHFLEFVGLETPAQVGAAKKILTHLEEKEFPQLGYGRISLAYSGKE